MKCPKCHYTSFDYLDECTRCGTDLRDVRTLLQIIAVSPEDRVARPPEGAPAAEPAAPSAPEDLAVVAAAQEGLTEEAPGEDLFEGLNFDDSFADMVEPTHYGGDAGPSSSAAPGAAPETASAQEEEEEELLDLDFGDLFGDKEGGQG
ncbi:MAG: hypothetical protein Kow0092_03860 [Deferrisomatales bacterium]